MVVMILRHCYTLISLMHFTMRYVIRSDVLTPHSDKRSNMLKNYDLNLLSLNIGMILSIALLIKLLNEGRAAMMYIFPFLIFISFSYFGMVFGQPGEKIRLLERVKAGQLLLSPVG